LHFVEYFVLDQAFLFKFLTLRFFFQAEDGIRERNVTGVQTCALPISAAGRRSQTRSLLLSTAAALLGMNLAELRTGDGEAPLFKIGRASCRERASRWVAPL